MMTRQIKILGIEKSAKYARTGIFDIWDDFTNKRKAHCKVCGNEILKGEGIGTFFWAMQVSSRHWGKCRARGSMGGDCICGFRNQNVFVCSSCDKKIDKINKKSELEENKQQ